MPPPRPHHLQGGELVDRVLPETAPPLLYFLLAHALDRHRLAWTEPVHAPGPRVLLQRYPMPHYSEDALPQGAGEAVGPPRLRRDQAPEPPHALLGAASKGPPSRRGAGRSLQDLTVADNARGDAGGGEGFRVHNDCRPRVPLPRPSTARARRRRGHIPREGKGASAGRVAPTSPWQAPPRLCAS